MKTRPPALFCAAAMAASLVIGCGDGRDGRQGPARVRIGRHEWKVEIAADEPTRVKGMAGRTEVPPGTGMLFVFPRQQELTFHMLDCLVSLDVAFIDSGGAIVEIRTMTVEPDPARPQLRYSSRYPVRYALEVAGGTFARLGIRPGDSVELLGGARDAAKAAR